MRCHDDHNHHPKPHSASSRGAERAFLLLRTVFTIAPIAFGLDKFVGGAHRLGGVPGPVDQRHRPRHAHQAMLTVGVIEIIAGIAVAVTPRYGACWWRAGWPGSS